MTTKTKVASPGRDKAASKKLLSKLHSISMRTWALLESYARAKERNAYAGHAS